jgi:hypothetical protein
VKSQMIHFLTFALVLQIHSVEANEATSSRPETAQKIPPMTEKLIVDRFAAYLADGDRLFVISVIDALLNLNGEATPPCCLAYL